MTTRNQWVRSISFNRKDSKDAERLRHIGKKSFSKYIKRLIDEDMKKVAPTTSNATRTTHIPPATAPKRQEYQRPSNSDGIVFNSPMLNVKRKS